MDDETRAAFDEMRRRFDAVDRRLDGMDQRFDAVDQRFGAVDQRFDAVAQFIVEATQRFAEIGQQFAAVDRRFETVMDEIRRNGVLIEDLRSQVQTVAEGERTSARAIEQLRGEMHERFRENEIIVGGAFRQIRRDIDELREHR